MIFVYLSFLSPKDIWSTYIHTSVRKEGWATPMNSKQPLTATGERAVGKDSVVQSLPILPVALTPCCLHPSFKSQPWDWPQPLMAAPLPLLQKSRKVTICTLLLRDVLNVWRSLPGGFPSHNPSGLCWAKDCGRRSSKTGGYQVMEFLYIFI